MELLEYFHTDPEGKYVDFCTDIVGNTERGIRFTLTYVIKDDRFRASIHDIDFRLEKEIDFIDNDVAKFMIGEEECNKLKEIHKEDSEGESGQDPTDELKNAFKEVIRLAKNGQQSWWTDDLKNTNNTLIEQVEEYCNEKYSK